MQALTPQRPVSLNRYLEALDSDETEDSEVQFVVLACDEKGNELPEGEIGVARCSLEQLVSDGKDHSGPLAIRRTGEKEPVGQLTCMITAIAALKAVENASKTPATAPKPAEEAPKTAPAEAARRRRAPETEEDEGKGVGLSGKAAKAAEASKAGAAPGSTKKEPESAKPNSSLTPSRRLGASMKAVRAFSPSKRSGEIRSDEIPESEAGVDGVSSPRADAVNDALAGALSTALGTPEAVTVSMGSLIRMIASLIRMIASLIR
jgi:hypothetical protein